MAVEEFTRASCKLTLATAVVIEASIDCGSIKGGDTTEPVCELTLESKTGPAWRIYQAALELLAAERLRIEDRSRAERGFALHRGAPCPPQKAVASQLMPEMSINDAFKLLVQSCLAQFVANQSGMLDSGDPEYLHQMRVALRRLRSVFSTFARLFPDSLLAEPVGETQWLAGALGRARDWDVFVIETLPPLAAHHSSHPGIADVSRAAARMRASARRSARRAVTSARGQGLLLALRGWLSAETWLTAMEGTPALRAELARPIAGFAQSVLAHAHRRVLKRGRHFSRLEPVQLHRLRVAAKKLRYAAEFFAPLYHERHARDYRAVLTHLQDGLGAYNDAVVLTRLAAAASGGARGASAYEARGIMLGWSGAMQEAGTRHLKRVWQEFRGQSRSGNEPCGRRERVSDGIDFVASRRCRGGNSR
jgi:CHAD domain-containing protein